MLVYNRDSSAASAWHVSLCPDHFADCLVCVVCGQNAPLCRFGSQCKSDALCTDCLIVCFDQLFKEASSLELAFHSRTRLHPWQVIVWVCLRLGEGSNMGLFSEVDRFMRSDEVPKELKRIAQTLRGMIHKHCPGWSDEKEMIVLLPAEKAEDSLRDSVTTIVSKQVSKYTPEVIHLLLSSCGLH